jgi:hypothetical protein
VFSLQFSTERVLLLLFISHSKYITDFNSNETWPTALLFWQTVMIDNISCLQWRERILWAQADFHNEPQPPSISESLYLLKIPAFPPACSVLITVVVLKKKTVTQAAIKLVTPKYQYSFN